jgi:hypothetical protein
MLGSKRNGELKKPLISDHATFQSLTDVVSEHLESLKEIIDRIEEHQSDLEKRERERQIKKKIKDEVSDVNKMINELSKLFKEFRRFDFGTKTENENKEKILRRLKGYFTRQHDRFTALVTNLQKTEKMSLEIRRSIFSSVSSANFSDGSGPRGVESFADAEIEASVEDIDFYNVILDDRTENLKQIRGIAYEIRLAADDQAKLLQDRQQDLETVVNAASVAERMVDEGNKEIDQGNKVMKKDSNVKKNLVLCLIVLLLCGFAVVGTLASGLIK